MFRYALALLLINTYGRGLGNPVGPSNGSLGKLLEGLAITCGNTFLSDQILSQKDNCNVLIPPYTKPNQFQCLLFYDINTQLCSFESSAEISVKEDDYNATIHDPMDVVQLCDTVKTWNISDLPQYPQYKEKLTKALGSDFTCKRLCIDAENIFSPDVNFFCKYFKWGSDLLKRTMDTINSSTSSDILVPSAVGVSNPDGKKSVIPVQINAQPIKTDWSTNSTVTEAISKVNHENTKTMSAKLDDLTEKSTDIKVDKSLSKDQFSGTVIIQTAPSEVMNNFPEPVRQATSSIAKPELSKDVQDDKIDAVQENPPKQEPVSESDTAANRPPVQEQTLEKKNKPSAQDNDYSDDLDLEDGMQDTQTGDEMEEPGALDEFEKPKKQQTKVVIPKKNNNQVFNTDISKAEYMPSLEDSFSDGDDDNFFPFFLSAIIMVVVIYVLYHNKSKVTKLVLGLIVEGRQPGRRRNSRGHAYRRLDTLEQAMSTNTTAAPSRIIY